MLSEKKMGERPATYLVIMEFDGVGMGKHHATHGTMMVALAFYHLLALVSH